MSIYTTTNLMYSSRRQFKSPLEFYPSALNVEFPTATSTPSSFSSLSYFIPFNESYNPGNLTVKCLPWTQNSFSKLATIRYRNMNEPTRALETEQWPTVVDSTVTAVVVAVDAFFPDRDTNLSQTQQTLPTQKRLEQREFENPALDVIACPRQ